MEYTIVIIIELIKVFLVVHIDEENVQAPPKIGSIIVVG